MKAKNALQKVLQFLGYQKKDVQEKKSLDYEYERTKNQPRRTAKPLKSVRESSQDISAI